MRFGAFLLASSMLASAPAFAGETPLYGPAPAFVIPAPEPDLSKKDKLFLVLDNQQQLDGDRVTSFIDTVSQVLSEQALAGLGQIAIPWEPAKGDLTIHRVTIVRGGETIDVLKQARKFEVLRREEQLEQLTITGTLTATMTVEGLRVGDVLRVTYSTTSTDAALKGGVQTVAPTPVLPIPMDYGRIRLLWPKDRAIAWRGYAKGVQAATSERDLGAIHQVQVSLPLPKPDDLPEDAPMRFAKLPVVEATSFADWPAVSRTMAPLYATTGLIAPGSALDKEAAAIMAADTDPLRRTQRALQLVQDQVRYLAVFMNDGNYVPQAPAKTWEVRYGDCKAKTLLLLALLDRMGIEAEPVLASLQAGGFVAQRLPAPLAFDHVLVRATVAGRTLWLDGTRTGDRLADIGDVPQLHTVLPLRDGGAELLSVNATAPARPTMRIETVYDQRAGLSLPPIVATTVEMHGPQAAQMGAMAALATPEQKIQLANGMLRGLIGESQFTPPDVTFDPDTATFAVKVRGVITTPFKQTNGRYRMPVNTLDLAFDGNRARPAWKDIPVVTSAPMNYERRTVVVLPPEAQATLLEGTRTIDSQVAGRHVTRNATLADGRLTVIDRMTADGSEVAPTAIPAERAKLAQLETGNLMLVAPADLATRPDLIRREGRARFKPLEDHYAAALKTADADESEGLVSRASFRAGIYDFRGAIEDYTKAIAIEPAPSSLTARASLYDRTGASEKALSDWRTAHDRDPGDVSTLNGLALQSAKTGDTKGALALLDERIALGGDDRFAAMSTKAEVLVRMDRGEEAISVMDDVLAAKPGTPGYLNVRCWTKATANLALDTALKDCTRAIELSDSAISALDSRGVVYFRMGRFDEALADFDAVLGTNWNMPETLYMRSLTYRRLGRTSEADRDLADATLMNPSLPATYAAWGIK